VDAGLRSEAAEAGPHVGCFAPFDLRAQTVVPSALRTDTPTRVLKGMAAGALTFKAASRTERASIWPGSPSLHAGRRLDDYRVACTIRWPLSGQKTCAGIRPLDLAPSAILPPMCFWATGCPVPASPPNRSTAAARPSRRSAPGHALYDCHPRPRERLRGSGRACWHVRISVHAVGSVGHQGALPAKWSDSSPGDDAQEPNSVANWRKGSAGFPSPYHVGICHRGPFRHVAQSLAEWSPDGVPQARGSRPTVGPLGTVGHSGARCGM
jgi:hypothetical protein